MNLDFVHRKIFKNVIICFACMIIDIYEGYRLNVSCHHFVGGHSVEYDPWDIETVNLWNLESWILVPACRLKSCVASSK